MNLAFGFSVDRLGRIGLAVAFLASNMHKLCGRLIALTIKQDQILTHLDAHDTAGVLRFSLGQADQAA